MIKQPTIQIKDILGKDWGVRNIKTLHWNDNSELVYIEVDFSENMKMYFSENEKCFINSRGNLKGYIKSEHIW